MPTEHSTNMDKSVETLATRPLKRKYFKRYMGLHPLSYNVNSIVHDWRIGFQYFFREARG